MLSNVRRKIVQKNIKEYSELQINEWWNSGIIAYLHKYSNFGNPRYSKNKMKQSFENFKLSVFVPYEIGNNIYNMIPCPSDSFMKGSNRRTDNNPMGKMNIEKPFLLGETEITQELYESVMGKNPSRFKSNPKNPVETVSWYDALIFCNKLSDIFGLDRYYTITESGKIIDIIETNQDGYLVKMNITSRGFRLPTEWEWEYAAKAGTDLEYSGSTDPNEIAWYGANSSNTTHPIKQKKPNAWGFYDMSGNVWEWCESIYDPNSESISDDRVNRGGGCYSSSLSVLRSVNRSGNSPTRRIDNLGFRVCRYI